jgi:hypothetical protein
MKIGVVVVLFLLQSLSFSIPWFSTLIRSSISPIEFLLLSVDDAINHMAWNKYRDEIIQFVMIIVSPAALISKALGTLSTFDTSFTVRYVFRFDHIITKVHCTYGHNHFTHYEFFSLVAFVTCLAHISSLFRHQFLFF